MSNAEKKKNKSKMGLGCVLGLLIFGTPAMLLTVVLVVVISAVAIPTTMATDSISRYPGGTWVAEQLFQANGREGELTKEEIGEVRSQFDEEMAKDEDLQQCFRGSPEVMPKQETLFVASPQERDEIIRYRDAKLNYNRDLAQYRRDHDRWRARMIDYQKRVRIARARHYRPDQIPPPPKEPQPPVRPEELPEKSYRMTAQERGGVSASADVDPSLISIEQAAVPENTPLRDDKGRATSQVNKVIDSVPKGTTEPVARLYLTVAFAGGVTGWNHFKAVMDTSGIREVGKDQVPQIAQSFFAPGADLAPYEKAVSAAIMSLLIENQISGDMSVVMKEFEDCRA